MKKHLPLLLALGLLASCGASSSSISSSVPSSASESSSSQQSSSSSLEPSTSSSSSSQEETTSSASTSSSESSSSKETSSSSESSSSATTASSSQSSSSSSSSSAEGKKTIKEIKEFIRSQSIETNQAGIGVDMNVQVTIEGVALAKFDLVKTKKSFGLDVSVPQKVLIGDGTDCIAVASKDLLDKVGSYVNDPDSQYRVTGYISLYLGQPELYVPEKSMFTYDPKIGVEVDYDALVKTVVEPSNFFDYAASASYNCAGHGYGDVIKMESLTCYYFDAGSNYYYFTDGSNFIKVVKNGVNCSVGSVYDLIGSVSLQNYAAALRLLDATKVEEEPAVVDVANAKEQSINALRQIKTNQDDTWTRYEDYTKSYGGLYYADVYFGVAEEKNKYYVGVADTARPTEISGKVAAQTGGMALIDNVNYWNAYADQIERYNPHYENLFSEEPVRVYYVPESLSYSSGKTCYKIFLVA